MRGTEKNHTNMLCSVARRETSKIAGREKTKEAVFDRIRVTFSRITDR